ncbi:MAG: hypothetical protein KJ621_16600, partial [Proteobacteria bacterium]|nr:hypothetical protein [Pseudomonadota bacterium]
PTINDLFFVQVVDGDGVPVPGASVKITPIWGRPQGATDLKSDYRGVVAVPWQPQVSDRFVGLRTEDVQKYYLSQFAYRVTAGGYLPAGGTATLRDVFNWFAEPKLKVMNRTPVNKTRVVIVKLYGAAGYLGPLAQGRVVSARLIDFLKAYAPRLEAYGLYFDVPALRLLYRGGRGVFVIRLRRIRDVRTMRIRLFADGVSTGGMRPNFGLDGEFLGNLLFQAADPLIARLAEMLESPAIGTYGVRVAAHVYDPEKPYTAARPVSLGFFITAADLARRRRVGGDKAGLIKLYRYYWDGWPIMNSRVAVPGADPVVKHPWWGRGPEPTPKKKKTGAPIHGQDLGDGRPKPGPGGRP